MPYFSVFKKGLLICWGVTLILFCACNIRTPMDAEAIHGRQGPIVSSFSVDAKSTTSMTIRILGQNFQDGAKVEIKGLACTEIRVLSSGEIACTLSSNIDFSLQDIVVTNPDGQSSASSAGFSSVSIVAPSFQWVGPKGTDDFVTIGTKVSLQWTDDDLDSNAQITFFYKRSNSGSCSSNGTPIGNSISENDETDSMEWDTTGVSDGFYYVCASISDGATTNEYYSDRVVLYPAATCTWVGDVDTNWSRQANWKGCPIALTPTSLDSVLILEQALHQPLLIVNTQLVGFGAGRGGGTLKINAGITLSLTSANSDFASDVTLEGATATCTTCRVAALTNWDLYIGDGATLTLKPGITALLGGNGTFGVGSNASPGHLIVSGGSNINEWPLVSTLASSFNYFAVEGPAAGIQSSVDLNGLRLEKFGSWYYNDIEFRGNFHIKRFDNLQIRGAYAGGFQGSARIAFNSCTRSTFTDTEWTGIEFDVLGSTNISASSCTVDTALNPGFSEINVSGSGIGFAPIEDDIKNMLSWNIVSNICTWNIAGPDRSWHNPANWLNCAGSFPRGYDRVEIPAGGNQPQIAQHTGVWGFSGVGGGTIEMTGAYTFTVNNSTFDTNIKFVGPAGTGNRAYIRNLGANIINGGVLTLGPAMGLETHGYIVGLNVGGNGAGTFKTEGGVEPTDWPSINLAVTSTTTGGVSVNGSPGNLAVLSIDGLIHHRVRFGMNFSDYYKIERFDNLIAYSEYGTNAGYLTFASCTGGVINDDTWHNLGFRDPFAATAPAIPNLIVASSATCSAAPFNVAYEVSGPADFLEDDPYNMFSRATPSCAGTMIGSYCWYLGGVGESCESVCASKGSPSLGTILFSGSSGTNANCQSVLSGLSAPGGPVVNSNSSGGGLGCLNNAASWQRYTTPTLLSAQFGALQRVCSCTTPWVR